MMTETRLKALVVVATLGMSMLTAYAAGQGGAKGLAPPCPAA
jgi:hypothetical protein